MRCNHDSRSTVELISGPTTQFNGLKISADTKYKTSNKHQMALLNLNTTHDLTRDPKTREHCSFNSNKALSNNKAEFRQVCQDNRGG